MRTYNIITMSFAQLRSQARSLENTTESLLSKYSSYTQSVTSSATEDENRVTREIQDTLDQRDEKIAALNRSLDSDNQQSATKLHQLQRHREILSDHKGEYKRIKQTIQNERNRTNLLTNVRSDIDEHRQRNQTEEEHMLNERQQIDNSNSMADNLLSQAYETRDDFIRQRANLSNIQRRMLQTAGHIPGLNTIIAKVNTRKKRDSVIIASLITLCILFLVFIR